MGKSSKVGLFFTKISKFVSQGFDASVPLGVKAPMYLENFTKIYVVGFQKSVGTNADTFFPFRSMLSAFSFRELNASVANRRGAGKITP